MGLSASQAQLLSITARISNNELRSQFITNAKLRLAEDSNAAASDYMAALDSTKLMYTSYNATGAKAFENLTPGLVMQYGDLKNQYGIINNAGQIYVTQLDQTNYTNSNTLSEFLQKYGVPLVENPKFVQALEDIYGKKQAENNWYDETNPLNYYNQINGSTNGYLHAVGSYDPEAGLWTIPRNLDNPNEALFQNTADNVQTWYNGIDGFLKNNPDMAGVTGNWAHTIGNPPDTTTIGPKPIEPPAMEPPTIGKISPSTGNCWSSGDMISSDWGVNHVAHHFFPFFDPGYANSFQGLFGVVGYYDPAQGPISDYGNFRPIARDPAVKNILDRIAAATQDPYYNPADANTVFNYYQDNGGTSVYNANNMSLISVINRMNELIKQSAAYHDGNGAPAAASGYPTTSADGITYSNSTVAYFTEESKKIYESLTMAVYNIEYVAAEREYEELYLVEYAKWEKDVAVWENAWNTRYAEFEKWLNECEKLKNSLFEHIKSIPDKNIPDGNDPKNGWYTNLWYRMGSQSETQKAPNENMYAVIEDDKLNNKGWLKYALELGIVTMEQVVFQEKGSDKYPQLKNVDWLSTMYTSVGDITTREDELAITRAEAKYNKSMNEITAQDKKYDQDLKKLDTEHNALQTQFESVKGVVDKNIERSFKAFS